RRRPEVAADHRCRAARRRRRPCRDRQPSRSVSVMRIAVLGTGRIGGTLGRAFAAAGHEVTFGARDPQRDTDVVGDTGAKVADVPGALADAEVVLVAVPGPAVAAVVRENAQALGGKLVV